MTELWSISLSWAVMYLIAKILSLFHVEKWPVSCTGFDPQEQVRVAGHCYLTEILWNSVKLNNNNNGPQIFVHSLSAQLAAKVLSQEQNFCLSETHSPSYYTSQTLNVYQILLASFLCWKAISAASNSTKNIYSYYKLKQFCSAIH